MEGSVVDLSKYRLSKAKNDLKTAKDNYNEGSYSASANRSYYAIFHALRAITALDQFDSWKHSGIIAYINQYYVKAGVFDRSLSKYIDKAFHLREKADYEDFYVIAIDDVKRQIENAESAIAIIEEYVKTRWHND